MKTVTVVIEAGKTYKGEFKERNEETFEASSKNDAILKMLKMHKAECRTLEVYQNGRHIISNSDF